MILDMLAIRNRADYMESANGMCIVHGKCCMNFPSILEPYAGLVHEQAIMRTRCTHELCASERGLAHPKSYRIH